MNGFGAIKWLARVGFLVKGVLYMVIGALALQVAAKAGGRVTGTRGALTTVLGQPFSVVRCCSWSWLGFSATPPGASFKDSSIQTAWATIGVALRSVRASWFAGPCTRCWAGRHSAFIEGCRPRREPASVRSPPRHSGGRSVIGWWYSRGSVSSASPCSKVDQVITCRLERNLDVEEMRREAGEWAVGLSRFGVAARAVVFALLGWAIVVAGWFRDPSEVGTTASSFRTLAAQPGGLGRWLLGVTAAGFVAYGFYEIIHARYLHIRRVR